MRYEFSYAHTIGGKIWSDLECVAEINVTPHGEWHIDSVSAWVRDPETRMFEEVPLILVSHPQTIDELLAVAIWADLNSNHEDRIAEQIVDEELAPLALDPNDEHRTYRANAL